MENIDLARRICLEVDGERREERENIVSIYNSNISDEEKLTQLKRKKSKFCRETLNEINPEKHFIVVSGRQRRKFYMKEFDARNSDYINIDNQIRLHLNLALSIRTEENIFWFEYLIKCFTRGFLPLFYADGREIPTKIYLTFKRFELKKILEGEIQNPIETRQNSNYIRQNLPPNVQNLIRYYNLTNPQPWPLERKSTSSFQIQGAVGIRNPIDIDRDGINRDIIVYARSTLGVAIADGKSATAYETLNFVKPPKTIENLFNMDREGETIRFNENRQEVRRNLSLHPENICITMGGRNENISQLGLHTKVKYTYIAKDIEDELPSDLYNLSIDRLQRILGDFE